MKEKTLKDRAAVSMVWLTGERFGNLLSDFLISVFLARILGPSEFGLIAMVAVFIALLQPFTDAGLGSALLRKKDATPADYDTVFWSNLGLSGAAYAIVFACAPLVAQFYKQPLLTDIIRVLGIGLVLNSLSVVQNIRLTKLLDFRTISLRSLVSNILSGGIGLYLAYHGWSYWALVVRQLLNAMITNVLYWAARSWFPSFTFSTASFRDFFGFGSKLLLSSLLDTGFRNVYPLLIGKFYSASALGFYNRAVNLKDIPQTLVSQVTSKVSYPVLIELQDDPPRLAQAYKRLMQLVSFAYFPLLMGLMGLSKSVILVLFTDKWASAIPLLQGLAFVGLLYPIHALNLNILTLKKRSDLFLTLEIIKKALTVVCLLLTYRWGVMGLIYGQIALSFVALIINTHYSKRLIAYGFAHQLRDLLPSFCTALAMGVALLWGSEQLQIFTWWTLLLWVVVGGVIYLTLSVIFNRKNLLYLYDFSREKFQAMRVAS
ncbi:lipopolysaccharide biosynthesis protein [Hymenobacter sp. BT507]|uniref:Lipopolysaccharide biosynthesis protein n=1 Tax=Hymenobacter citatus TaxID=2763506 RepID=A0ABR7MHP0_9BACT|nr:lipopolysaccharide biosynthesis protein [Hymenobacter citatus]MBC6610606.1 lipopolysaccharide biosynthesis protein [Hymenobacter citatus]